MNKSQLNGNGHGDQKPRNGEQNGADYVAKGWLSPMPATKAQSEVPVLFREPYLLTGFRPLNQHWSYYAKSLFQIHNECLNVWTHLIAFFVTGWKLLYFVEHYDLLRDPYMWPLTCGFMVSFIMFLCSSGAHCFQSHSPVTHYNCFLFDYAGIGLYGFGCAQLHFYYCAEPEFYEATKYFFIPLSTSLGLFAFLANTYGKLRYRRPYPKTRKLWQMGSVFILYLTLISPVMHRYYVCYKDKGKCSDSLPVHFQQILCFLVSGVFYGSSIPQRFFPGKFDFLAHSHQLFHVFISMTTFYKFDALLVDVVKRKEAIFSRPAPSFLDAFGPSLFIMTIEVIMIVAVQGMVREKISKGH